MSRSSKQSKQLRVAVIDDDEDRRDSLSFTLEDAGFKPLLVTELGSLDTEVKRIADTADVALCDHRLSMNGYAEYRGAELAAALCEQGLPAVLVTAFNPADQMIRRHRKSIPRLLVGEDVIDGHRLAEALLSAVGEIVEGKVEADRIPRTTLIHVEYVDDESGTQMVYAKAPGWRPEIGITFPLDFVPADIRKEIETGATLLASINTGAGEPKDIYVAEIQKAPEPDEDVG